MRAIPTDLRNSIFSLINQGKSIAQTASKLGLSTSTVSKYKNSLAPLVGRVVGGRVAKLSDSKKRLIKRKVLDGKLTTAVEVHRELGEEGYELSYTTVRNTLHALGFEAKTKKKKPFLSARHRQARYNWAKEHQHWTVDDWRRVVWTDETKINVWGSDGVKYCWVRPDDPLKPHHLEFTVKHGKGSLMMWGCMSYEGIGYGCHIQETMNVDIFIEVLENAFQDSLDYWGLHDGDFIFQQDNDPKHTSKKAKKWF